MVLVLIVDDSPTEQHVISKALEKHGFETVVASDGEEAIEIAELRLPDLILMDIVMPGMNGFQATRQLAKNPMTASIPVVMVTSKDQETDKVWGLRQGAVEYLMKPIDDAALVSAVQENLS
ncbi:MAG: response regulator [Gammaproteobacteria bacterium]|jgi:twitching motility two-component system response regulator PilH|nr:response regulator [Gammaproteobacteria bacterium]